MHSKIRAASAKAIAATALVSGVGVVAPAVAWAAGSNAGLALIVDPATNQNLNAGGSQNIWTIKVPAGAACSGDTAGQQYHVNSYIADAAANPDPGLLTFNVDGPVGNGTVYPLYDVSANPYVNAATAITSGAISNVPNFDLNLFSIDGRTTARNPDGTLVLPAGTYNIGLACAKPDGTGDKFWNTQIVVAASGTDVNGEAWQTQPNPQVPELPLSILLPLSAAAVLGGGVYVTRRRKSANGARAATAAT